MKSKRLAYFLCLILLVIASCGPEVYIKARVDPEFNFRNASSVVIFADTKSIEQKQIKHALSEQLTHLGYQVIDGTSAADLQVQMETKQDNGTYTESIPMLSTTTTNGNVGGINVTGYTTTTQMVPYTESYSYTKTRILFSDGKNGSVVWDCFLSIETKDYNEYFMKALQDALSHLGKDYEGKDDL
jgi:hypothetical protein